MNHIKTIGLSLVSLLGLSACVSTTNTDYSNSSSYNTYTPKYTPKPSSTPGFVAEKWYLTTIDNKSYQGRRITFNISTENKINGFSGCNRYFVSNIKVNGSQIKFGSVGATKKLCMDSNSSQLERKYLEVLGSVDYFDRNKDRLVLSGRLGNLIFYKKSRR